MIGFTFISLVFILHAVTAMGGTEPILERSWLLKGESSRFYFTINCDTDNAQTCTYTVSDLDPLTVVFDEDSVTIDPHSMKDVFGAISVPIDAPIKIYRGDIEISCSPFVEGAGGGSVIKQTFHMPLRVNVVEQIEERPETKLPTTSEEEYQITTLGIMVILLVIVIIVILISIFWLRKKAK